MAMGTERSKTLHNFTMPAELRWGNQRHLRCMKVNSDGQISPLRRDNSYSSDHHRRRHQQPRTTRDKDSSSESLYGSRKVGPPPIPAAASDGGDGHDHGIAAMREKVMLDLQTAADRMKESIFKDGLHDGVVSVSPPPSAAEGEFAVALSKREIEEDFMAMVGHRPARRPKKRAKFVQKQLDTLFPGLWLTEVTSDMYKVDEAAP
ncbi:hypothetical protein BUALT_BualtUnG0054900 [Buddleja alternifolia]|uniref:Uncharacterized protein n=1 Tax=Buddleja alternifolia TaxID=168488 RepID=A0AAV6W3C9_9LAMI|nr:hypothetical protein BUALT_BualtUnG0054900 [Buddleja alternifolia]